MATAEPLNTPISRLQMKELNFHRVNRSKSSEGRRKTAAERLEADKLKYVKSAEARQKRSALDNNTSHLRNVQSTGALSHHATAAVSRENENRNGNDAVNDALSTRRGQFDESQIKLNRSKTDVGVAGNNSDRFRTRSATEQAINSLITSSNNEKIKKENVVESNDHTSRQSCSPKDSRKAKFFLNKAKESLKSVTSSFSGSAGVENPKTRQSRPAIAKSSCQRSRSAGANAQRHLNTRLAPPSSQCSPEIFAVSPRTQLKNARENLKKVSHSDENKNVTKPRGKTFVIKPKQNVSENKESAYESVKLPKNTSCTSFLSQRSLNQPLSTIDNTVSSSRSCVSSIGESARKKEESAFSKLHISKPIAIKDNKLHKIADSSTSAIANETNNHTLSAFERLKGSTESSSNHLHANLSQSAVFAPIQDSTNPHFSNVPRQRKSWSRVPVSDLKKSSNRVSFNEETLIARPDSRKSLTEALEEIINPPDCEDDMDTAYHSMSPDASVECKTLLATANQTSDRNPIGRVPSGVGFRGARSKTPESSRSRTPIFDEGISFGANDVDLSTKDGDFTLFAEQSKSGKSSMTSSSQNKYSNSTNNETVVEMHHNVRKSNNESSVVVVPSSAEVPASTMMAPKERKEVAPDFSISNKTEHLNTMKSQNTSSSTSGDMNKPLTALTAADLKPRGGFRFGLPLNSNFSQPGAACSSKTNFKRPNNTPISPAVSPTKQAARMTPSQGSTSSTPHSSLKRTPASSLSSSLKRNRQRSKSDVSILQSELDRFFSTMGMDDPLLSPFPGSQDTLFTTALYDSESDFSFAGASAYVRDSIDSMDVDTAVGGLTNAPSVSIIEKNARIMRWLRACNKPAINTSPRSSKRTPIAPAVPPRPRPPPIPDRHPLKPPPIPPRLNTLQNVSLGVTKESDV